MIFILLDKEAPSHCALVVALTNTLLPHLFDGVVESDGAETGRCVEVESRYTRAVEFPPNAHGQNLQQQRARDHLA